MSAKSHAGPAPWASPIASPMDESGIINDSSKQLDLSSGWHKPRPEGWTDNVKYLTKNFIVGSEVVQRRVYSRYEDAKGFKPNTSTHLAEYAAATFDPENKRHIVESDGVGHISYLKYAVEQHILEVTFADGTTCQYFKVPHEIGFTLIYFAQNKSVAGTYMYGSKKGQQKHKLGVFFWEYVRIKHKRKKANYPFRYEKIAAPDNKYNRASDRHFVSISADMLKAVFGPRRLERLMAQGFSANELLGSRRISVVMTDEEMFKYAKELELRLSNNPSAQAKSDYAKISEKYKRQVISAVNFIRNDTDYQKGVQAEIDRYFDIDVERKDVYGVRRSKKQDYATLFNKDAPEDVKRLAGVLDKRSGELKHTLLYHTKFRPGGVTFRKNEVTGEMMEIPTNKMIPGKKKIQSPAFWGKALNGYEGQSKATQEYLERQPGAVKDRYTAFGWTKADLIRFGDASKPNRIDPSDAEKYNKYIEEQDWTGALNFLRHSNTLFEYSDGTKSWEHYANQYDFFMED